MASIETDANGVITRHDDRGRTEHLHSDYVWINARTGAVGIAAGGVRTALTPTEAEMVRTIDRVISAGNLSP